MRGIVVGVAACAVLLAGCGSAAAGGGTPSDALVVTPDPRITPQPASDPRLSCMPRLAPEGTVSDLVAAGPCVFDYLGSARCGTPSGGNFTAAVQLNAEGGGAITFTAQPPQAGQAQGSVWLVLVHGPATWVWGGDAPVTLARDHHSVTIRPVVLPASADSPGAGVETVRGVLTCG